MQGRKRAGFTMMEILIAAVVLLILASVAMAGYQGYRDRAAMLVDETNQQVLAAAVKLYAYDNNALPGSLSQLQPEYLKRAFAEVTAGKRPDTLFTYLQEWTGIELAEAQVLPPRYYNNNPKILNCPLDRTPPSYQIEAAWRGASLKALLASDGSSILIEEDPAEARHVGKTTIVVTTVSGAHQRKNVNPPGGQQSGGSTTSTTQ